MVWSLSPTNPSLGTYKYYFTSPGAYKVGRKDCAVVIQVDKTVSRLHAEIIIEALAEWSASEGFQNIPRAKIRLRDLSKFGTFVNKENVSRPVFSLPDQEVTLKEGDAITFGTNNSTFRLGFHLFLIHVPALLEKCKREAVISAVTAIGGHVVDKWCDECTHLLVEDGSQVTETVIEAVIKKKSIISIAWIQAMSSRTTPDAEIPSLSRFAPTLTHKMLENFSHFKVADPKTRGILLQGFTFIVGPLNSYESKGHLCSLIEVSGGNAILISQKHLFQQVLNASIHQKNTYLVLPTAKLSLQRWLSPDDLKSVLHMPRTDEQKLVSAVLAGHVESNDLQIPTSPAFSASSDETIDVNGPEHGYEVTSFFKPDTSPQEGISAANSTIQRDITNTSNSSMVGCRGMAVSSVDSLPANDCRVVDKQVMASAEKTTRIGEKQTNLTSQIPIMNPDAKMDPNLIEDKTNVISAFGQESKADIVLRNDLVVTRSTYCKDYPSGVDRVKNFKCFKRKQEVSGNSFDVLVPFAKEPYRESDYAKEVKEYMLQESRLKEAETLAEELFNAEQLKRQKASVSGLPAKHVSLGKVKAR